MRLNDFFPYVANNIGDIWTSISQHIIISLTAVILGFIVAFPVGILFTRNKRVARVILAVFGVVNTIPSLVLLGVAMVVLGLGFVPAVAVLFVYSLLPIMRNTYIGISEVDPQYVKAAKGVGMSRMQILVRVEIPLALPVIIAGVRLSTVYVISWGTLSTFIGAGGLGDLLWGGLSAYNYNKVFSGALPATLLALLASFIMSMVERLVRRRTRSDREVKQ